MPFEKGQSGNPSGRKKGTLNKTTKELRGLLQEVLLANFSRAKIAKDLKELSPKHRLEFYFKLLEYILSKPTPTEIKNEEDKKSDFFTNIFNQLKENKPNNNDSQH